MLEILVKLFGREYVNRMIGTRTNISKPIKFDKTVLLNYARRPAFRR